MSLITDLTPINLSAEREKFFANNYAYNPQFIYSRPISISELTSYGLPKKELVLEIEKELKVMGDNFISLGPSQSTTLAPSLCSSSLSQPSSSQAAPPSPINPFLSQLEIKTYLHHIFETLKIPPLKILFSNTQLSRTTINSSKNTISFRLPLKINIDVLRLINYHEIQTHYLRYLNHLQQPWPKPKKLNSDQIRTEEGLALYNSLHSLSEAEKKSKLNHYRYQYYLTHLALNHSFQEVYQLALPTINDPEQTFQTILRLKRGLTDTGLPGAFTKGIVYWEGYLQILEYLKNGGNYNDLYWGKIAIKDIETLRKSAQKNSIITPTFD